MSIRRRNEKRLRRGRRVRRRAGVRRCAQSRRRECIRHSGTLPPPGFADRRVDEITQRTVDDVTEPAREYVGVAKREVAV